MSLSDPNNPTLQQIVEKMMRERDIKKYKIYIDGGTGKQDGFLGEILFFHLIINNGEKLHLVLKSTKPGTGLNSILSTDIIYEREFIMYTQVVPAFMDFTKDKISAELDAIIPPLWFATKHLGQVNIVLENLKMKDFHIRDRKKFMDPDHMRIIFDTYGKWHGAAMALRDQHPKKFQKLVEGWLDPRAKMVTAFGFIKSFEREMGIVRDILVDRGRLDIVIVLDGIYNRMESILYRRNLDEKESLVISHGDNWNNNFMFKYKDCNGEKKPTQVYFLDFQLSRLDSPVFDLSSSFYNMGDKDTLKDFNNLLSIYHESLSRTLKILGSNPDELFSMNDLKRHWKEHSLFAVLHCFTYLRVATCDAEDAPDLSELAENGLGLDGAFSFETKNMNFLYEKAADIFIHYGEVCKNLELE